MMFFNIINLRGAVLVLEGMSLSPSGNQYVKLSVKPSNSKNGAS